MNLDNILIFILWLLSVRDLIAKNFDIPKNKRWSFLFYNNKEINEVSYCYQLKKIHDNSMPIQYNSKLILQMLIVLGIHTKYFENKVFCDRDKTIETKYLVSTLEASYIKS